MGSYFPCPFQFFIWACPGENYNSITVFIWPASLNIEIRLKTCKFMKIPLSVKNQIRFLKIILGKKIIRLIRNLSMLLFFLHTSNQNFDQVVLVSCRNRVHSLRFQHVLFQIWCYHRLQGFRDSNNLFKVLEIRNSFRNLWSFFVILFK